MEYVYNHGNFVCQACMPDKDGRPWTYTEWLLTMEVLSENCSRSVLYSTVPQPHLFGVMGGSANPTGLALFFILLLMFVCSLPFVRRRGHFEIFYWTHLLYYAYFVLLLIHAPEFWKWFLVVGLIWVVEIAYRILNRQIALISIDCYMYRFFSHQNHGFMECQKI